MENRENNISFQEPDEESLLTYIRGKATAENVEKIENWLREDAANEKILLQIAAIYFAQNRKHRIEKRNSLQAFEKARRHIKARTRIRLITRTSVAAACILGVIVLSSVISYLRETPSQPLQAQIVTVQSNAGMRSQFNLPDGTVVFLNSGSSLSYPVPFDAAQRNVSLVGEAYFKVAHSENRPFIADVSDNRFQVRVLGTEFNLRAFADETHVAATLVSGKVDISAKGLDNKIYVQSMLPSEKVDYDILTGKTTIEKVETRYETGWIEGKLMFRNCLLPEVLKKLSYFYNVKFNVQNEKINNYRFTGTFDNKQLFQVLDYLQISSDIKYHIKQVSEDDSGGVKYTVVTLR